jgi:hypothetical protein
MATKDNNAEIWTLENGNVCFKYERRKFRRDMWLIIIPLIVCATLILAEFITQGTFVLALPGIIFICFVVVSSLSRTDKKNENTEKEIIWKILCTKVKSDTIKYGDGVNIVQYKYQIDIKGTYGIITGKCLMVLLSNNKVLEYKVEYHKPEGEKPFYNEVFLESIESTNPEHLKIIQKRNLINFLKKPSEKTQLIMWIAAILTFSLGIIVGIVFLVETFKWNLLIPIAIYIILRIVIFRFIRNKENKVTKVLRLIIDIPFELVCLAMRCIHPAFSIIAGFLFMTLFAVGIPLFILFFIDFILQIDFTYTTYIFVIVSAGTILCVYRSKFMHGLLSRYTPLRDWGDHEFQKLSLDLVLYVLQKKNMTFLIYLAYFVFMAITGFKQIQYATFFISSDIDAAVTRAFLIFIAYTNMISKSSEVDINSKELLTKIVRLLLSKNKPLGE